MIGSGVAHSGWGVVQWHGLRVKVLEPSLAALFLGLAFALMVVVTRLIRRRAPAKVNRVFRRLQLVSGSFVAFTHGTSDAQKTWGSSRSRSYFRAIMPGFLATTDLGNRGGRIGDGERGGKEPPQPGENQSPPVETVAELPDARQRRRHHIR